MSVAIVLSAAVLLLGSTLTAYGWTLRHLRGQQARIGARLDDLTRRLTNGAPPTVAPFGAAAPPLDAISLAGGRASLEDLLAPAKPLVLVFSDPRCGPCYELLPDVGGWQRVYGDRLTIALVSGSKPESNRAMTAEYGIAPATVLLQVENEIAEAFGVRMAPAAVVVTPEGRLGAGPVYGANAVRKLVADTLGLALPEQPARARRSLRPGEPAPAVRRPDLAGEVIDLASFRGEPLLLLFWNPGCSHCQELLPSIKAWEERQDAPRMIVVSRGPVALNQEAGLRTPIVLDDDRSITDLFGVQGTPAAVVIDASGLVASPVARGASGVRALVAQRFAPAVSLAAG